MPRLIPCGTMQTCSAVCTVIKPSKCSASEHLMYEYHIQTILRLLTEKDTCLSYSTSMWFLILMQATILWVFAVEIMFITYKIVSETVIFIKLFVLNLISQFGAYVHELWKSVKSFLHTLKDAVTEIWLHLTKENVTSIFALAILVYVIPDVLDTVKDILKKNVIACESRSTLK